LTEAETPNVLGSVSWTRVDAASIGETAGCFPVCSTDRIARMPPAFAGSAVQLTETRHPARLEVRGGGRNRN